MEEYLKASGIFKDDSPDELNAYGQAVMKKIVGITFSKSACQQCGMLATKMCAQFKIVSKKNWTHHKKQCLK